MSKKLPWYKRMHREIKKGWDRYLRPTVEPVLLALVGKKVKDKADRL